MGRREMITKEKIDQFFSLQKEIKQAALSELPDYYNVKGLSPKPLQYVNRLSSIDEMDICFEGDEPWSYGESSHHFVYLPLRFLYSSEYRETLIQEKIQREADKREKEAQEFKKREELLIQQKRDLEEKERQEYERLRLKYGNSNDNQE